MTNQTITINRSRKRKRSDITRILAAAGVDANTAALFDGWNAYQSSPRRKSAAVRESYAILATVRGQYGFDPVPAALLSPPKGNAKLAKGTLPAYGLTGQSHIMRMLDGALLNGCTSAGHCTQVCVLNTGHGQRYSVQTARDYRSEFLAREPLHALRIIGYELARAAAKHADTGIAFRPNVNFDVEWFVVVGNALTELNGVRSYGYTKHENVMTEPHGLHHVAYSWGETSNVVDIDAYLARGGNVAAVTDRRPGDAVTQWHATARVVDADKTDEWMFDRGVIGDLSAKGKARQLIGKSGFVREVYAS